jgi:membrane protease YdiL (CAAX protease family)
MRPPVGEADSEVTQAFDARRSDPSPWDMHVGAAILVVTVAAFILVHGIVQVVVGATDVFAWPPWLLVGTTGLTWLVILGAVRTLSDNREQFLHGVGWAPVRSRRIAWAVVGLVLALAAAATLASTLEADAMRAWTAYLERPGALVITVAFAVTLAPLFEELYFRGFWQGVLRRRMGAAPAVLLPALGFAALHGGQYNGAWFSLTVILLLGLSAGVLREVSGSTLPAVMLHLGYNSVAIVASLLLRAMRGS